MGRGDNGLPSNVRIENYGDITDIKSSPVKIVLKGA